MITADGGYRNAEVVAYKETYTDPALDNYLPLKTALDSFEQALGRSRSVTPRPPGLSRRSPGRWPARSSSAAT